MPLTWISVLYSPFEVGQQVALVPGIAMEAVEVRADQAARVKLRRDLRSPASLRCIICVTEWFM